ncbi:MAG: hypothetical protein AAGJ73_09480 [Pseudomonadota bacterium]
MRFLAIMALAALAAGCVTAVGTSYGPAADAKGFGYEDSRIEDDRFRIIFRGDGATPAEAVEDFALLRAAELAIENDFDWFRIVSSNTVAEDRGGVGVGAGFGSGSYGRRGGVNVGVGGDLGTIGGRRFFTTRMEVLCGRGPEPDEGEVYNAREVATSIRERIGAFGEGAGDE